MITDDQIRPRDGFCHEALLYSDDAEFLARVVPFVRDGISAGEGVLVATDARKCDLVRAALDVGVAEDPRLRFLDMADAGRNPGAIISLWADFLAEHGGEGRHPRGLGEPVWAGRSEDELAECLHHELALNLAFASSELWLICPYDTARLDRAALACAGRSHPLCWDSHGHVDSEHYHLPTHAAELFSAPLRPAPRPQLEVDFGLESIAPTRRAVRQLALDVGLTAERASDVALAASEALSNSVRHGGGRGRLRAWTEGSHLALEVRDRGLVEDPLVGRLPVGPDSPGGRGLWLVNQLSDLVQLRTACTGTTLRMQFALPRPA